MSYHPILIIISLLIVSESYAFYQITPIEDDSSYIGNFQLVFQDPRNSIILELISPHNDKYYLSCLYHPTVGWAEEFVDVSALDSDDNYLTNAINKNMTVIRSLNPSHYISPRGILYFGFTDSSSSVNINFIIGRDVSNFNEIADRILSQNINVNEISKVRKFHYNNLYVFSLIRTNEYFVAQWELHRTKQIIN